MLPIETTVATKKSSEYKNVVITWRKCSRSYYKIYRSKYKNKKYQQIATVQNAESYRDEKGKRGTVYYYKIIPVNWQNRCVKLSEAESLKVRVSYLKTPKVKAEKKKYKGNKVIEIKLKDYEGTYAAIEGKVAKKYIPIKIKKKTIRKYKGVYRLAYQKEQQVMYFRVRTWKKIQGKKRYSAYSKVVKVQV